MKFLAIVVALLAEQARPLRRGNPVHAGLAWIAAALEKHFNAGQYRQGMIAWLCAVAPLVLCTLLAQFLLGRMSGLLYLALSVVVLYVTMGFRRFSHYYNEILEALRDGDLPRGRRELTRWINEPADEFTPAEMAKVSIERGLIDTHRSVFGPVCWFILLGPAGVLLYRAAVIMQEQWEARLEPDLADFGGFAAKALFWIDWLPSRLTALSFAAVGNFEDAIYCWRTQAASWAVATRTLLAAAGGGALGVKLGDTLHQYGRLQYRPELGMGEDVEPDHMHGAIGLVWRSLVLWMFLVFLVTLAHSLG